MSNGLYDPSVDRLTSEQIFEALKKNGIKSPETPAITVGRLDEAISNVLGADVAMAMQAGCVSRPARHAAAIQKAFTYGNVSYADAAVLREAQIMLDTNGAYEFS